jgi:hypothetical protein
MDISGAGVDILSPFVSSDHRESNRENRFPIRSLDEQAARRVARHLNFRDDPPVVSKSQ